MSLLARISSQDQCKIRELFQTMSDSPGEESLDLAKIWIQNKEYFTGLVDFKRLPIFEDSDQTTLGFELEQSKLYFPSADDLKVAITSSENGAKVWNSYSSEKKSSLLKKVAQGIEKHAEIIAQIESLCSHKRLHRTKTIDVPNLIQSFYYNASIVDSYDKSFENAKCGVVCVNGHEENSPTLSVSLRVASVLAAGNSVLLSQPAASFLSALFLAELCGLNGLPPGVFNVIPINHQRLNCFPVLPPSVVKIIWLGCLESLYYDYMVVGLPCEFFITQKKTFIIYESADLCSAVSSVFETLISSHPMSSTNGCKVYVQTSIEKKFHNLLKEKLEKLSIVTNLPGMLVADQHKMFTYLTVEKAKQEQFQVLRGNSSSDWNPAIICNVPTTSTLLSEFPSSIVVTVPFKTVKESIEMFNHSETGSDASVWTEKLTLGLEVAHKLTTRTVWLNSQDLFDASVAYGGLGLSGNSIEGGQEGFLSHWNVPQPEEPSSTKENLTSENTVCSKDVQEIKYGLDLYIGGSFKKGSKGTYRLKNDANGKPFSCIAEGFPADVQSAITSAAAAQSKWQKLDKYKLSQILHKAAESLKAKEKEFAAVLADSTRNNQTSCEEEFNEAVSRIKFWANRALNSDGLMTKTEACSVVLQERNSLGVIGIVMPDEKPFLSFVSLVIPAIAFGNAVVALASEKHPVPALKMCEILQSSGVLGGVVNVIAGDRSEVTTPLVISSQLDAVWLGVKGALPFDVTHVPPCAMIKRVFNCHGIWNHFSALAKKKIISESTYLKAIYMPMGNIFAN